MYYKLGQACVTNWGRFALLQIRANVVTNWGTFVITNWGKCCCKLGQLLQIRATVNTNRAAITNWGKIYYKLGQVLQIRAIITNWSITVLKRLNKRFDLHDFSNYVSSNYRSYENLTAILMGTTNLFDLDGFSNYRSSNCMSTTVCYIARWCFGFHSCLLSKIVFLYSSSVIYNHFLWKSSNFGANIYFC